MQKLDELFRIAPQEASQQLKALFYPSDFISISGKKTVRSSRTVLTQIVSVQDMCNVLDGEEGKEYLSSLCFDPEPMDVYFGIGTVLPGGERGPYKRVKEADIRSTRVLYADLDVKAGSFTSTEEAWEWVWDLCLRNDVLPTYIVNSGSGGLHVYWKYNAESMPGRVISPSIGKELSTMWWAWMQNNSDIHIDKLVDMARMSRLSGTIHWPKKPEEAPGYVYQMYCNPDNTVDIDKVHSLCKEPYTALQERRKQIQQYEKEKTHVNLPTHANGKWTSLLMSSNLEEWLAENMTWEAILQPCGWVPLRTDSHGRVEWARPGQSGKSATTDWPESPHVMSLLSTSIETNLSDLLDAGIVLTKWRVFVRLYFNDDFEKASQWTLDQIAQRGFICG